MEETARQHCPIQNHLGPMDPCSIIAAIADNGRLGCPSVIPADFYAKNTRCSWYEWIRFKVAKATLNLNH